MTMEDRRMIPQEEKKYQIKVLREMNHQILRLASLGLNNITIAKTLGITSATVCNTVNSRLGQQKLVVMRGAADAETIDIMKEIREMAPKALKVLEELLEAEKDDVRFKAATDVLDRGGYGAKIDIRHLHAYLTAQDIEEIKTRGKQLANEQSLIVDGGDNASSEPIIITETSDV